MNSGLAEHGISPPFSFHDLLFSLFIRDPFQGPVCASMKLWCLTDDHYTGAFVWRNRSVQLQWVFWWSLFNHHPFDGLINFIISPCIDYFIFLSSFSSFLATSFLLPCLLEEWLQDIWSTWTVLMIGKWLFFFVPITIFIRYPVLNVRSGVISQILRFPKSVMTKSVILTPLMAQR